MRTIWSSLVCFVVGLIPWSGLESPAHAAVGQSVATVSPTAVAGSLTVAAETFTAPALRLPERPSTNNRSADLSGMDVLDAPPPPMSINLPVSIALTAMALLATLVLALRLCRTPDGMALTMAGSMALALGSMAALMGGIAAVWAWDNRASALAEYRVERLRAQSLLVNRFDRYALDARIAARGFLVFQQDENVVEFLDTYVPASQILAKADKVLDDEESRRHLGDISAALADYGRVITTAVKYTDERSAIFDGQITPAIDQLRTLLAANPNDQAAQAVVQVGTVETLAARLVASSDPADAAALATATAALVASVKGLNDRPGAQAAAQFIAERCESLGKVIAQRFDVIFNQCPTSGRRLGDLATVLVEHINTRLNAERDAMSALGTRTYSVGQVVNVLGLLVAVGATLWLVPRMNRSMGRLAERLRVVAAGDLRVGTSTRRPERDEFGRLENDLDRTAAALSTLIAEVRTLSDDLLSGLKQIDQASGAMAQALQQQTGEAQQATRAAEAISRCADETSGKAEAAAQSAAESGRHAREGGAAVSGNIEQMRTIAAEVARSAQTIGSLGRKGEQIGRVIAVINDIADQTNLLALNAAIEAARAGEHGRGFAVVADEVRKLAERTTSATSEIGESIRDIQTGTVGAVEQITGSTRQVEGGMQQAAKVGQTIERLVTASDEVTERVRTIAQAATLQSTETRTIAQSISEISQTFNHLAERSLSISGVTSTLSERAARLDKQVARFRV
jgi:methyl-accepting chemotaxis protein